MQMTQLVLRSTRLHESMRWFHNPHTTKHVGNSNCHDPYSYVDDTDNRPVASHHSKQTSKMPPNELCTPKSSRLTSCYRRLPS
jgi:hypothetical protein